jgi:predicted DCC family thiol-disulfide oxidoreductase YuxK
MRTVRTLLDTGLVRGSVIFDGECGFCTRSAGWLRRLDRRGLVDMRPLQGRDVLASAGLSREQAMASVWWLGSDGRRARGAEAVNAALSAALGTRLPLALYRLTRRPQERVYAWVSANRHRLRGVTPYCTSWPQDC